jgi:hypothetical protein
VGVGVTVTVNVGVAVTVNDGVAVIVNVGVAVTVYVGVGVTVEVVVTVGVTVFVKVLVAVRVYVAVAVGVGRLLVNVTKSSTSPAGEPGRPALDGIIVLVCAVSLYMVSVPYPFASVVPFTVAVFSPVTPVSPAAVKIAAPLVCIVIALAVLTLFPYTSATCSFIKTVVPIPVNAAVVLAMT